MSRSKRREKSPPEMTPAAGLEEFSSQAGGEPDQAAPAPTEEAEPTVEQQIAKLRDENLRLMAELRNLGQRAQREKQEALRYAEADFAKELLVVLDDLERTLESAKTTGDVASLAEGVRIVYEHFLKVLRGRQIEPIEALGKPFDPHWHEAMMQQPSEEHPAGTVTNELTHGYRMHDRVIRPAKVVVSGGPPTQATEREPTDEPPTGEE